MKKAVAALAFVCIAGVCLPVSSLAQSDDMAPRLQNANIARELRTRAAKLGVSSSTEDTTWVGYTPGKFNATNNWFSIGSGTDKSGVFNRPPAQGGLWDFEPTSGSYVHGDSAMGWLPYRFDMTGTGGLNLPDVQRPWRAIDYGNAVNYTPAVIGGRTANMYGVTGVWHVDPGNTGAGSGKGVTWTPLAGNASAWMGLRRHGDLTAVDAVARGGTGNMINEDALMFGKGGQTTGSTSAGGSDKAFPGYGGRMDQLLYRDIAVGSATSLHIRFRYRTNMSTGIATANTTRVGWFQHDPLTVSTGLPAPPPALLNVANPNFIRSDPSGGAPPAPADSFMVYIGAPAEGSVQLSDGNVWPIRDPKRRWFGEVVRSNENLYTEVFGARGTNAPDLVTRSVDATKLAAIKGASGNSVRLVFRVKTNWQFDDETSGFQAGAGSSGAGAAVIDDVEYSVNGGASFVSLGGFESATEIDNRLPANATSPADPLSAFNVWKSTGKPPKVLSHIHPLFGRDGGYEVLDYDDLCGFPGNPARICDLDNVMWSMGNHDDVEASGGEFGTAEQEPFDGVISPPILLGGGIGSDNAIGLDEGDAVPTDDYYISYDLYTGRFDFFNEGSAWWFGAMSYPTINSTATYPRWGEIRHPGFIFFNPDRQCFTDFQSMFAQGLLRFTTNPAAGGSPRNQTLGIPDSIRIVLMTRQEAYRFGLPISKLYGGAYFDNVSLAIVDGEGGDPLTVDIWQLIHDTFPQNENSSLVGVPTAFDTTTALVKSGLNIAQTTGDIDRFDVPGDTTVVVAEGANVRVDLVFRILPGPGNYVNPAIGVASQLKAVPTSMLPIPTPAPGVNNFWSNYLYTNGSRGSAGGHPTATTGPLAGHKVWSPHVWNSARMDTAEINVFNLQKRGVLQPVNPGLFMTTYHESELNDPHRGALGITRNICFVTDSSIAPTARPTGEVLCGSGNVPAPPYNDYPPEYVTAPGSGYNGLSTTKEGTKIIPDGVLTPGAHVEYFFRREDNGVFNFTCPDTNVVFPQTCESSTDGHRWQEFSVLPDRWKSDAYTHPVLGTQGDGGACFLYVDQNDRRGNERVWIGVADSMGATAKIKRGAHNGWGAPRGHDINDPLYFVRRHIGQAGSTFDMYGVKASESLNTGTGSLGSRASFEDGSNTQINGKISRQGPTQNMLNNYYRILVTFTGDLNSAIYGPFDNKSQNDYVVMQNFLLDSDPAELNRGIWMGGDGLLEAMSETEEGEIFSSAFLGVDLLFENYIMVSGNTNFTADVVPTAETDPLTLDTYGIRNACTTTLDVLTRTPGLFQQTSDALYYEAPEGYPGDAFPAAVVKHHSATQPWFAWTEGINMGLLNSQDEINSVGRLRYYWHVSNGHIHGHLGDICQMASPVLVDDVAGHSGVAVHNAVRLANNPLRAGSARIDLSLAQDDYVEVRVYDVTGRVVRDVFKGNLRAGTKSMTWDGQDDRGRQLPRGVYFAQVRYQRSGFNDARKVVVLK
jgi:hypothetical protein